ncbi:hypothetical protein [Hyalangium minutum]|uniref:hypothetical protein n=1 Tax=Hyalangium minutum TaxID=394096 RepID=UPI001F0B36FF|nr:hypothetical protein [Hyalangium minutum]
MAMRFRTFDALLHLLLLSACATMDPVPGEVEDPSPRLTNLQRAAQYPWTDDGHCVVREASNEWPVLAEQCFHVLDHDRVKFRDVTGKCAVASAGAAAATMGVGLCVFASPAIVAGAVIVIGTVMVAIAVKEGLDAYEQRASRERARPSANRKPNLKKQPDPKGSPEPVSPPIPSPEEKQRWRQTCRDHYVACKEFFAGEKQRRVWGESQCQSCMDLCMRDGQWPDQANDHPCPGG